MTDGERREELGEVYEWEEVPGLTALSEEGFGDYLRGLSKEEWALSYRPRYRRRVLQGSIGLVRGELVRCGGVALSSEELARVLVGRGSSPSTGGGMFLEPMS